MALNPILSGPHGAADALRTGAGGVHAGLRGLDHAAHEIAASNVPPLPGTAPAGGAAVAGGSIALEVYRRDVQAAAAVVKTADHVLGFLLDIRA